ncbi:hypothetical protein BN1723_016677 [Verticillium longisporum]|uniref:Uncharacterized protein n=1 Tax=Verticillium longisporum TaxID=100787 RepID=A0A0G4NJE4_VERLO|nr:hypothetical protein BN1723_016677 [Verticillium longisporum]
MRIRAVSLLREPVVHVTLARPGKWHLKFSSLRPDATNLISSTSGLASAPITFYAGANRLRPRPDPLLSVSFFLMVKMVSSARTPRAVHAAFPPPQISHHELVAFHEAHFSHSAIGGFTSDFLNPQREASQIHNLDDAEPELQDDDDGLGYYDDGVKRTLTDEQIAMFRHSELEALRRKGEKLPVIVDQASGNEAEDGEVEDGGNATSNAKPTPTASSGAGKKKKKGKKSARSKPYEPKPDLRKRTWDIVETGLDTLEYD